MTFAYGGWPIDIPDSLGLKIDAESWTWGFDATVPAEAFRIA